MCSQHLVITTELVMLFHCVLQWGEDNKLIFTLSGDLTQPRTSYVFEYVALVMRLSRKARKEPLESNFLYSLKLNWDSKNLSTQTYIGVYSVRLTWINKLHVDWISQGRWDPCNNLEEKINPLHTFALDTTHELQSSDWFVRFLWDTYSVLPSYCCLSGGLSAVFSAVPHTLSGKNIFSKRLWFEKRLNQEWNCCLNRKKMWKIYCWEERKSLLKLVEHLADK